MENNPCAGSPGWRSRGYIPHFDRPGLVQLITIRLYDAVPEQLIEQWKAELRCTRQLMSNGSRQITLGKQIETYEDAGRGSCWLQDSRIARMVQSSLLYSDAKRYRLLAWCIMPNHLHCIIEPCENEQLGKIIHSLKSYTAHEANKILKRSGQFWFREYHDRYIRNEQHLEDAREYVEYNPVKAKLVFAKEHWEWSSARERAGADAAGTAALRLRRKTRDQT